MQYTAFSVRPLSAALGAEIHGLDLTRPLGEKVRAEIHQALLDHQVIFFRDQKLTPEGHMALAGIFGEPEPPHPIFPNLDECPQVSVLENDEARPPEVNVWHTDVTWKPNPPLGSVLHGVDVPVAGGDTLWASMYAAYDALSPSMQKMLQDLKASHTIGVFAAANNYESSGDGEMMAAILKANPPVEHPVLRTHPETGRTGLFVNATFTTHIVGLPRDESRDILDHLARVVEKPEVQVRFKWEPDSVAIWDNRCTQHYAVGDYYPQYRRMHRITVIGDKPYYRA